MTLQICDVSKAYRNGVQALKNVTLTIPAGTYGLLGPNGAGKSTLMRILATLQEADGGSVQLGGIDVLKQKEEVRRTLGYLPQDFGVYPKVNAEELLEHFAILKGIAGRRARQEVVEARLRQTNLWDVRKQKLGGNSGGMRQRFGVAAALLGHPKLMIVDEPTAGLDPAERVRFLNLLSEPGENSVVLLSTHIVEDVSEVCIRMAIIDQGEILLEAEPLRAVDELDGRIWSCEVLRKHPGGMPRFKSSIIRGMPGSRPWRRIAIGAGDRASCVELRHPQRPGPPHNRAVRLVTFRSPKGCRVHTLGS